MGQRLVCLCLLSLPNDFLSMRRYITRMTHLACPNDKVCGSCDGSYTGYPFTTLACDSCFPDVADLCSEYGIFQSDYYYGTFYTFTDNPSIYYYDVGLDAYNAAWSCPDNCLNCDGSTTNYDFCNVCDKRYYLGSDYYCYPCNSDYSLHENCLSCNADLTCNACENGFLYNGACVSRCPSTYFGKSYYAQNQVILSTVCEVCDYSCYECNGDQASQCTACYAGDYLYLNSIYVQEGTCYPKSAASFSADIFVTTTQLSSVWSQTGGLSDPYDNLFDAIERAYELAAPYYSATVTINMMPGNHFLVKGDRLFYLAQVIDKNSQNLNLIIKPSYCTDSINDPMNCAVQGVQSVTIYNKMRGFFQIEVSQSLTIQDIVIDSLDSLLSYEIDYNYLDDKCLNERVPCCGLDANGGITTVGFVSTSFTCASIISSYYVTNYPTDDCHMAKGESVFKFSKSAQTVMTSASSPQSLTLTVQLPLLNCQNCAFNNFIYEFNSFIELNDWGSIVSIASSSFSRFSNCGSIIRNYHKLMSTSTMDLSQIQGKLSYYDTYYPDQFARSLDFDVQIRQTRDLNAVSPLSCTTSPTGSGTQCFSIDISDSTFEHFNFMKDIFYFNQPPTVSPDMGLHYWGLILSLEDFQGKVRLTSNSFNQNLIFYQYGCYDSWNIPNTYYSNTYRTLKDEKFAQIRNLISIRNSPHEISIVNNTFFNNTVVKGVIYIESQPRSAPVLIASNTFKRNAALYSTIGIYIRSFTSAGVSVMTSSPSSESNLQCGGYYIFNNTYKENSGCTTYATSVLEFECVETASIPAGYLGYFSYSDTSVFSAFNANSLTWQAEIQNHKTQTPAYLAIVPTTSSTISIWGHTYEVFLYFLVVEQNTYINNYASGNKGIISITGTNMPIIKSEYFLNNGDAFDEKLVEYVLPLWYITGSFTYQAIYMGSYSTCKAQILLESVLAPRIQNVTIDGGFIIQSQLNKKTSSGILITNSRGPVPFILTFQASITDSVFKNIQGQGFDSNTDALAVSTSNAVDQNVISFYNSVISYYDFTNTSFKDILIKGLSSSPSYLTQPYLIRPDLASSTLFYTDYWGTPSNIATDNYMASSLAILSKLTLSNVTCRYCANFLFFFASNDIRMSDMTLNSVNGGSTSYFQQETSNRTGVIGFLHIPLPTIPSLTLFSGASTFHLIQGTLLKVYFYDTTANAYTYTFTNTSFTSIYQNQINGCLLKFENLVTSPQQSIIFTSNNVTTLTQSALGPTIYYGSVIYASNIMQLTASLNRVTDIQLTSANGEVFYVSQSFATAQSLIVTLDQNYFNLQPGNYGGTIQSSIQTFVGAVTSTTVFYAPIYVSQSLGSIAVTSHLNEFYYSPYKHRGGFISIVNQQMSSGTGASVIYQTTFSDDSSIFSDSMSIYGGHIYCLHCTSFTLLNSAFTNSYSLLGGTLMLDYSVPFTSYTQVAISITSSTFTNSNSISHGGVIYIAESGTAATKLQNYLEVYLSLTGVTGSQMTARYTNIGSYTGNGGFLYTVTECVTMVVDSTSLSECQAQNGGCFYLQTANNDNTAITHITFQNSLLIDQAASTLSTGAGAIMYLSSNDAGSILIDGGTYSGNNGANNGQLFYLKHTGTSSHQLTLQAQPVFTSVYSPTANGCFFYLYSVTLTDLLGTIYSNATCSFGGALYLELSTAQITLAQFDHASAQLDGGVIYLKQSNAALQDLTFTTVSCQRSGGVIYQKQCSTTITNVNFNGASAVLSGGILYLEGLSSTNIESCMFQSVNSVSLAGNLNGGVLYMTLASTATINNSNFTTFTSMNSGGVAYLSASTLTITNSQFSQFSSIQNGGVAYLTSSTLTMSNCQLDTFSSIQNGGAVYLLNSGGSISGSDFSGFANIQTKGGVVYMSGSTLTFTTSVFDQFSTINKGGILYAVNSVATLTSLDSTNFNLMNQGGAYYVESGSTLTLTSSTHTTYANQAGVTQGGVIFSQTNCILTIDSCQFTSISKAQQGAVIYVSDSELTSVNSDYQDIFNFNSGGAIYGANSKITIKSAIIDSIYQPPGSTGSANGGFISLSQTNPSSSTFCTITASTISNINGLTNGNFAWLSSADLTISTCTFFNFLSASDGKGGIIYTASASDASYSISLSSFKNITIATGGIVYDQAPCNANQTVKKLSLSSFNTIESTKATTIVYMYADTCKLAIDQCTFQNFYANFSVASLKTANAIYVGGGDSLSITGSLFTNFEASGNIYESLVVVDASNSAFVFTFTTNGVKCQSAYNEGKSQSLYNVISYTSGAKFTADLNTFSFCNTGAYGIYYLNQIAKIADSQSSYQNNSALQGGVYFIQASSTSLSTITLTGITFSNNYGGTGGVISAYNYFSMTISQCAFTSNSAVSGGAIYISQLTTMTSSSSLAIKSCSFSQNTAESEGGVIWVSHSSLNMVISGSNVFQKNEGVSGGVFYIGSIQYMAMSDASLLANEGTNGRILYSIANNAQFIVQFTTFQWQSKKNAALDAVYLAAYNYSATTSLYFSGTNTSISCRRNIYTNNYLAQRGGVFYLDSVTFKEQSSIYINNTALLGGAISCSKCQIKTITSNFTSNSAKQGGVIYLESDADYSSLSDYFGSNVANTSGGGIFATTRTTLNIQKSKFLYNKATTDAAISAYMTSDIVPFLVSGCLFKENTAYSNTMSFKNSNGQIVDSIFLNNVATVYSSNIFLSFSSVNLTDSILSDTFPSNVTLALESNQIQGQFLFISLGVTLRVDNCSFLNGIASQGGAIFLNGLSNLHVFNSFVSNNYANQNGGAIYASGYELIEVANTSFDSNNAGQLGSEYYALFSLYYTKFSNVTIRNSSAVTSLYCDSIMLNVSMLKALGNNGVADKGGAITCMNCPEVIIDSSIFSNQQAKLGGSIYLEMGDSIKLSPSSPTYNLTNSYFYNSNSSLGGAIYLNNPESMTILNSTFNSNSAFNDSTLLTSGYGGGIYYTCSSEYQCYLAIQKNNSFVSNYAANSGGGIKWDDAEPDFDSTNTYQFNSAKLYGDNIASFAQKLISITEEQYKTQLQKTQSSDKRMLSQSSTSVALFSPPLEQRHLQLTPSVSSTISNQQSGGQVPTIYIALGDKYNNIVGNTNSAKLTVRVDTTYNKDDPDALQYAPVLNGNSSFSAVSGVFNASDISFTGSPGNLFKIVFETDGIDNTKPSNKEYLAAQNNKSNSTAVDFPVFIGLRECMIGESFSDSGKCTECSSGSQYLLTQLTSPGQCQSCPNDTAICYGGSRIGPQPGYWRMSANSSTFIKCPNAAACLGILPPDYNPQGDCAPSYEGVLCSMCQVGYSRTSSFKCSACPQRTTNAVRLLFILIAVILGVIYLVRSTLNGAKEEKNVTSIYLKILMNHFQLIVLTASFNFDWPEQVLQFFSISAPVTQVSSQIFSVDCFIDTRSNSSSSNSTTSETDNSLFNVFYIKLIMMAVLPFMLFVSCYAVWYLIGLIKKNLSVTQSRAISSVVIILFLVHPNIVQYMFSVFNCYNVDTQLRVYDNLSIVCYKGNYTIFAFGVAIPGIILWGLGIPFFAWMLLSREKEKLNTIEVREKFGFLYRGYKKQFYYWESVIMYRKIILIFIQVFIQAYGVISQALIVFILLISCLVLNTKKKPFVSLALNDLETFSLAASMITIYCGLFYISDHKVVSGDSSTPQLILSGPIKMIFFLIIFGINILFFGYWIVKMYQEMRIMLILKYSKVYLACCLCCNNKRFEIEKKAALVAQENEFMREDYMKILKNLKRIYNKGEIILDRLALEKLHIYLSTDRIKSLLGQHERVDQIEREILEKRNMRVRKGMERTKGLHDNGDFQSSNQRNVEMLHKKGFKLEVNLEDMLGENSEELKSDGIVRLKLPRAYGKIYPSTIEIERQHLTEQPEQISVEKADFVNKDSFLESQYSFEQQQDGKIRSSRDNFHQLSTNQGPTLSVAAQNNFEIKLQQTLNQSISDEQRKKEDEAIHIKRKTLFDKPDRRSIKPKKGYQKLRVSNNKEFKSTQMPSRLKHSVHLNNFLEEEENDFHSGAGREKEREKKIQFQTVDQNHRLYDMPRESLQSVCDEIDDALIGNQGNRIGMFKEAQKIMDERIAKTMQNEVLEEEDSFQFQNDIDTSRKLVPKKESKTPQLKKKEQFSEEKKSRGSRIEEYVSD